jgi:PKD repeat protein
MKRLLVVWAAAAVLGALVPAYVSAKEKSSNQPPVAVVAETFVRGSVPLKVCFDASKSSDPEGKPLTYKWEFGDGKGTATTAKACHEYAEAGLYAATLTVTDEQGQKGVETVIVFVRDAPKAAPRS